MNIESDVMTAMENYLCLFFGSQFYLIDRKRERERENKTEIERRDREDEKKKSKK